MIMVHELHKKKALLKLLLAGFCESWSRKAARAHRENPHQLGTVISGVSLNFQLPHPAVETYFKRQ